MTADRPTTEPRTEGTANERLRAESWTDPDHGFAVVPLQDAERELNLLYGIIEGLAEAAQGAAPLTNAEYVERYGPSISFEGAAPRDPDARERGQNMQTAIEKGVLQNRESDLAYIGLSEGAAPRAEGLDLEALRMERGWPTPISMRHAADALDKLAIPKYGDVLRWVADLCDGAAPRAEGLDVERLADLEHEQWAHWKESDREWARKVLARLSRPSDERVPESEEPR